MSSKKIITIIFIIIIVFLFGLTIGYCSRKEEKPQKIKKSETRINEIKIKKLDYIRKKENIVFLGDSITEFYPINDIFIDLPIINSGKSGYKTTDILEELDTLVYQYNPTSVYLLIGTNDFMKETDDNQIEEVEVNIKEIVEKIKENRKSAKIYIESIYPVNSSINKYSVGDRDNEEIQAVNKYLEEYCKENNIVYIDIYSHLEDENGELAEKYSNDGLHVNEIGYARVSQVLIPYIYDIQDSIS